MKRIRGMTWDHERGYAPLEEASRRYQQSHPDIEITWERRSLQAFADRPIDLMAKEYDLMIIDHPHVGEITRKACLVKLDQAIEPTRLQALRNASIGPSFESYDFDGHQWALPIDAAAQVACSRADLFSEVPNDWKQVIELAKTGQVLCPLKPVDAVDGFFSLCANLGSPVAQSTEQLVDPLIGQQALETLAELASLIPDYCLDMNPIQVLEIMASEDTFSYCPLLFGYTNYSRAGYRKHLVQFHDMPSFNQAPPHGSIIGGTGICVSNFCEHQQEALDFSMFVAGAQAQSGFYFEHAGQPSHQQAWQSQALNAKCHNFFKNTYPTLANSWVRPRYDGYMGLADNGGDLVNDYLRGKLSTQSCLQQLEHFYQHSLTHPASQKFE